MSSRLLETAPKKQSLDFRADSISTSRVETLDPFSRFYGWRLQSLQKSSLQSLARAVSGFRNWVFHVCIVPRGKVNFTI